jgi:ABC-type Na+ efflux pump permease subunit
VTAGRSRLREALDSLLDRLGATARIARWELSRSAGTVDRRTAALSVLTVVVTAGVAGAAVAGGAGSLEGGLYRVGVAADSPYHAPVERSDSLVARSPDAPLGEAIDVRVGPDGVTVAAGQKGQAALAAFRTAVRRHNQRLMRAEANETAAFPVTVDLRYADRTVPAPAGEAAAAGTDTGDGTDVGPGDGGSTAGDSSASTTGSGRGSGSPAVVPDVGGVDLFGGGSTGSPADIDPPFPFASLVLAFAFLVPMNFVIQAYGSSVLSERVNRRGELLLVAPVEPGDIVAGKTLPYLGVLLAVTAGIAVAVGAGGLAVAAVFPLGLLFLSATFAGAMFARSFKELTFVTVAVSTFLTTYAFVPAIYTDVTPVALISPLTVAIRDIQGVAVTPTQYAFSTGPAYLSAAVLFLLGTGIYREEDMFTQRPVPLKFLDALDARLSGPLSVAGVTALSIPFVFVAELLALATLFTLSLPPALSVPLILVVVAVVEELAKSLHVYAGFESGRFSRSVRSAVLVGGLSGVGFFVGEKLTLVVQLVGLQQIQPLGAAAFGTAGVGGLEAAGLLVAPLALHVVTGAVSAAGASRGRRWYAAGLAVAIAGHAGYNIGVVSLVG